MILLRPDCLVFKTTTGENIPCSAEEITLELLGEAVDKLDQELVQNAAHAVLHYFRYEEQRNMVTIGEFAETLAKVLRDLGLQVTTDTSEQSAAETRLIDADLRVMATEADRGFELVFFQRLRDELRTHLSASPNVLRFSGLQSCVKEIVGARRWTGRCQQMHDQIVQYLRDCWSAEAAGIGCALVVR